MAKLNYYQFPVGIDAHTRFKNGAVNLGGECTLKKQTCQRCEVCEDGWRTCDYFKCLKSEEEVGGITITTAKRLLKEFGGQAWTNHCDREGSIFEVSKIMLKGNNSQTKYNRHL